eukprot:Transcript_5049.p1 GENE.Transcript_5049~~Transcript_5049.p1  ORF type:complete len:330 (-),score=75.76 Transcript_5049:23-964(-)
MEEASTGRQYWVEVPAGAAPGTHFQATAGEATASLTVPPGMASGELMVINGDPIGGVPVAAGELISEDRGLSVVQGVLVEPDNAASEGGGVVVGTRVGAPTTLQVLRGVLAQGAPLWEAGHKEQAERVFRAGFDVLVGQDPRLATEMEQVMREYPGDAGAWNYRRVFDSLIQQDLAATVEPGSDEYEYFLYFWDARDGSNWTGWWITPEHIGCTRYYAHAAVDVEGPHLCGGQWEEPCTQMVVTPAADGGMLVSNAAPRSFLEGHYARAELGHRHRGASGEVRPSFKWDRPLSEAERLLATAPAKSPGCCVIS